MNAFNAAHREVQWEQWKVTAGRFFDLYLAPSWSIVDEGVTGSWRDLFIELLVRRAETDESKPLGWEQDDELAIRLFCDCAFLPVTQWMIEQEGKDWQVPELS